MIGRSFRARLSLWNVAVLALILAGIGALLAYGIHASTDAAVDRELRLRAQRLSLEDPPPPRPRRFGPADPLGLGPPEGEDFPPDGPDAAGAATSAASTQEDRDAERAAAFTRAEWLNRDGDPFGPPGGHRPWDQSTVQTALSGRSVYSNITVDGERVRVFSAPFYREGNLAGVIQVVRPLGDFDRLRSDQSRMLLLLAPVALVLAGLGALFLTGRALRPVREVTQAAAQISAENLGRRLEVHGEDELAQMAATFNAMITRLEAAFEQQRRFTADASHELRTPLARIKVTTSSALAEEQSLEEYRTALRIADRAADGMSRLVQELLLLARMDAGQMQVKLERLDARELACHAIDQFPNPGGVHIDVELPEAPLCLEGDPNHLMRVLVNLLENAARHTPSNGRICISGHRAGQQVVLQVRDTGEGIAPEHLPHLGERFYRVDASRTRSRGTAPTGGSGLGLAISRTLMEAHGGTLTITSELGRGTTVTLTLPAAGPLALAAG